MRVEIRIDESLAEPKVVIETASMTDEVSTLVRMLSESAPRVVAGARDGKLEILDPADIIRIYAGDGKVYAVCEKGEFVLRLRLYELEERLDPSVFARISNSEIVNLKKVDCFDLKLSGTVCVRMSNGDVTYVSRRYVGKLKKILGL